MNGVQLENANVGYSLAEPAGNPPASAPADRPSFDDHLQQAHQQSKPASRARQEERPRETPAPSKSPSPSPPAERDSSPKEIHTEHDASPQETHSEHPAKESTASKEAAKEEPKAAPIAGEVAVAAIAIASAAVLNLPKEAASVAVDANGAKPETASEAPAKDPAATVALAAGPQATAKQLDGVIPTVEQPPRAAALVAQTDTITAPAAQAADPASATIVAPAQSLAVAAATVPARNKDDHADTEATATPDDAPVIAVAGPRVLDLPLPQQPDEVVSLVAAPDKHSDKVPPAPPAPAVPQHKEEPPPTTDTASPPPADNSAAKPPSFALPARASQHATGGNLSEADRARFVQRVARAFESAGDNGQMRLRLSPPELGSLRLDVTVRHGVLSAHVEAETPQARMLLLDNLPALRDRLQEQNIKIERFDVDLMNQSPGGQPQSYRQQRHDPEEPAFSLQNSPSATDKTPERPAPMARRPSGGEKLNIVI